MKERKPESLFAHWKTPTFIEIVSAFHNPQATTETEAAYVHGGRLPNCTQLVQGLVATLNLCL